MITETSTKEELLTAVEEAISGMSALMMKLDEKQINSVPYENSWTAGQLLNHVTQSNNGMAKAMLQEPTPVDSDATEKIAGFKKVLLDLSSKLKSPDFILPKDGPYEKKGVIHELKISFNHFRENTEKANMNDMVEGMPFGPVSKLELLHFVLYHTQRHLHQLKNIAGAFVNE
jgi:hypothetical protein